MRNNISFKDTKHFRISLEIDQMSILLFCHVCGKGTMYSIMYVTADMLKIAFMGVENICICNGRCAC